jgi:hypothetical protein
MIGGLDQNAEDLAFIASEYVGNITAEQTNVLVASMDEGLPDEDADGDAGNLNPLQVMAVNEAINETSSEHYRLHGIFRLEPNRMVGSIGRSNTVMTHFSTEYPGLRDVYTSITGNPDSTSEYVADTILQLLASGRDTKMPPAHWLSSADLRSAKSMRRLCSPTQLTCISTPVSRRLSKLKLRKMDHLPGATAIRVQVDKAIAWRREDV